MDEFLVQVRLGICRQFAFDFILDLINIQPGDRSDVFDWQIASAGQTSLEAEDMLHQTIQVLQREVGAEIMVDSIAAVAYRASPVADIAGWRSPVLIVHGDDDRNVPFEASIDLVRRLRRKGDVIFHELYFPDEAHGFLLHCSWLEVFRQATDFFERYLKTGGDG